MIAALLFLACYFDSELLQLWSSISDINHPTMEEYRLIDDYLGNGKRLYLDRLRESELGMRYSSRIKSIENLRLVGSEDRLPIFERHELGDGLDKRCIVLYSSFNGLYPKKARKLLSEIEETGFNGHVLLRIGGFPNTPFGGLKICHVPYSFKVAALQEARCLGYENVLWLDLAIHPLENFDLVFSEIETRGYFVVNVGSLDSNRPTHLYDAAKSIGVTPDMYGEIPHLSSSIIGLNMKSPRAIALLEKWYHDAEDLYPFLTWWPEELSLSVSAWRAGCEPYCPFGDFVCMESEQFQLENRPAVSFYLDGRR